MVSLDVEAIGAPWICKVIALIRVRVFPFLTSSMGQGSTKHAPARILSSLSAPIALREKKDGRSTVVVGFEHG